MFEKLFSRIVYFLLFDLWRLKIENWPVVGDWLMNWWYAYDMSQSDGIDYCQDCGAMLDWDIEVGDDIVQPAYVTASGDLFCRRCGIEYDRAEEEDYEDYSEFDFYEDYEDDYDDGEPDFTLDDLEWDESYPELSDG